MVKDKFNIEPQMIAKIRAQLGHIFDVDDIGNLTLKPIENIPSFKMIYVQGGEFIMGDGKEYSDPPHSVQLTYNYFIGEFPITQELYLSVTGNNPSYVQGVNHPVGQVNLQDAIEFCNLLNKMIGFQPVFNKDNGLLDPHGKRTDDIMKVSGFRLPTEAEWEYSACGGASTGSAAAIAAALKMSHGCATLFSGSNYLDEVGWYNKNNNYETKPVGLKFPNELGIYDMSGNVWEWCIDWFDKDFFMKKASQINPVNLSKDSFRVLRGGSWRISVDRSRMTSRTTPAPTRRWYDLGFRLLFAFQFT
jgi:formylglycine-generating enzyme